MRRIKRLYLVQDALNGLCLFFGIVAVVIAFFGVLALTVVLNGESYAIAPMSISFSSAIVCIVLSIGFNHCSDFIELLLCHRYH